MGKSSTPGPENIQEPFLDKEGKETTREQLKEILKEMKETQQIAASGFDFEAENQMQLSIVRLIHTEPFYGAVLCRLKRFQNYKIATVGVAPLNGITMIYNPIFFKTLSQKEKIGVLKHEIFHLIFRHFTRRKAFAKKEHWLLNVCFDLAINSLLRGEVPSFGLFPDMPQLKHLNLEERQPAEWYYERLKDGEGRKAVNKLKGKVIKVYIKGKENQAGSGDGGDEDDGDSEEIWLDEHEWDEMTEGMEIEVRRVVEESYREARGKGIGGLPQELIKEIENFIFKNSKLPWQKILHNFILRCTKVENILTRTKPNRRFRYLRQGVRYKPKLECTFIVDTSGSVDTGQYEKMVNELGTLSRMIGKINLIFCDEHAYDMGEFRMGIGLPKRVGNGGTGFHPALRYTEEHHKPDVIIYMTDGYPWTWEFEPSKIPTLWVITTDVVAPTHHGKTVHLE